MVVGKIYEWFDDIQRTKARSALLSIENLYDSYDNACTYAMTGLLTHLLRAIIGGGNCYASSYTSEKIKIIEGEVN